MRILLADAFCSLGELGHAVKNIRLASDKKLGSISFWNTFSRIIIEIGGINQLSKSISVYKERMPNEVPICLMQGNVHLAKCSYSNALVEYMTAYKNDTNFHAIIPLCIANLYANYGCSGVVDKDKAMIQAFAWLQQYEKLERNKSEAAYNAGRIAQQFKLMHLAVPLYQEALKSVTEVPDIGSLSFDESTRLPGNMANFTSTNLNEAAADISTNPVSREAAFNLSLILRESGSDDMARAIMKKYLTF